MPVIRGALAVLLILGCNAPVVSSVPGLGPGVSSAPAGSLSFNGLHDAVETFELPKGSYMFRWTATDTTKQGCPFRMTVKALDHDELVTAAAIDIAPDGDTVTGDDDRGQLAGGRYAAAVTSTCSWTLTIVSA
jgi:hypothetical protein